MMLFIKNISPVFFIDLHEACKSDGYTPHEYFLPQTMDGTSMCPIYTDQCDDGMYRVIFAGTVRVNRDGTDYPINWTSHIKNMCETFHAQIEGGTNSLLHGGTDPSRKLTNRNGKSIADYDILSRDTLQLKVAIELSRPAPLVNELMIQYRKLQIEDNIKVYSITSRLDDDNIRMFDVFFKAEAMSSSPSVIPKFIKIDKVQVGGFEL